MPSPLTVYSGSADGYVRSFSLDYSTARAGAAQSVIGTELRVGQITALGTYYIYESFVNFDTSSIPDDATVDSATLSLYLKEDNSTASDFVCEARALDWGATLATDDWVADTALGSLPLLATLNSSGIGATEAYKAFTSEVAFAAAINKSGLTSLIVASDRQRTGTFAGGSNSSERLMFYASEDGGKQPKLVVAYTEAGGSPASATFTPMRGIW